MLAALLAAVEKGYFAAKGHYVARVVNFEIGVDLQTRRAGADSFHKVGVEPRRIENPFFVDPGVVIAPASEI